MPSWVNRCLPKGPACHPQQKEKMQRIESLLNQVILNPKMPHKVC
nr:MAG TPA: hypothetical protein [Caudoviricetes sp.]